MILLFLLACDPISAQGPNNDCSAGAVWYGDGDGDGYGTTDFTTTACDQPARHVANADDCDDGAADIHPAGEEICNSIDDDCDGGVDQHAVDATNWYADVDGDGFGDPEVSTPACESPSETVANGDDCMDGDAAVSPDAIEMCDVIDNDCDGEADEDDAADAETWFADTDGDLFGDPLSTTTACVVPSGYSDDDSDCDDTTASIHPGAVETCNDRDDDCDASIDDNPTDPAIWYFDADADGYGRDSLTTLGCEKPVSYAPTGDDCNDVDAAIFPGAPDVCDATDSDCDGEVAEDDSADAPTWYTDADGDGYGDATLTHVACIAQPDYAGNGADCDDADGTVNPDESEYCDGADDDCDGVVDEDSVDATLWYIDTDGDGYGDDATAAASCAAPVGTVAEGGDCDEGDDTVSPGDADTCGDGVDNDCDGAFDGGCRPFGSLTLSDADGVVPGTASASLGSAIAVGDVTGDAYADVLGGASAAPGFVVAPGPVGDPDFGGASAMWHVGGTSEGASVAVGDLDDDGVGDVIVSDYTSFGRANFYPGPITSASLAAGATTIWGFTSSDLRLAVADMDDDGVEDLIMAQYGDTASGVAGGGSIWVDEDPPAGGYEIISSRFEVRLEGTTAGMSLGSAVDASGDIDGDGIADIAAGTHPSINRALVFLGPITSNRTDAMADVDLEGVTDDDYFGIAVTIVGDNNGDGYDELLVGAPASGGGSGAAYLFDGPVSTMTSPSAAVATFSGTIAGDYAGYTLAAGDVDGDELADVMIGDSNTSTYVLYGPTRGTFDESLADAIITGSVAEPHLAAGDTEATGFDTLILGDRNASAYDGAVYAFLGGGE